MYGRSHLKMMFCILSSTRFNPPLLTSAFEKDPPFLPLCTGDEF